MATAKKVSAKTKVSKKPPSKSSAKSATTNVAVATTSTSVVSSNIVVAKTYEEIRREEISPYAKEAMRIASNFENITKKIAVFETEMLYKYLGQTYDLYKKIQADKKNNELFYGVLRNHLKQNGIKTNKNTSEISLLIRLIFKVKPKTAHLYSRAIEAAYDAKIKPLAFVKFVEDEGGLEKLRLSQVEKEQAQNYREAIKRATELVPRYLRAMEGAPIAVKDIPGNKVLITPTNYVLMIGIAFAKVGNPTTDVEVRILSCLPPYKDTEDFAFSSLAREFAKDIEQAEKYVLKLEGKEVKELKT